MNYEELSDFEINKLVCLLRFSDCTELEIYKESYNSDEAVVVSQGIAIALFDFNNPSDAWPVIVENKIGVDFDSQQEGKTCAYKNEVGAVCYNANPLRAAMIVYLMMKDAA